MRYVRTQKQFEVPLNQARPRVREYRSEQVEGGDPMFVVFDPVHSHCFDVIRGEFNLFLLIAQRTKKQRRLRLGAAAICNRWPVRRLLWQPPCRQTEAAYRVDKLQ